MQEKMSINKIIIAICAAALVILTAVVIFISNRKEAYRSIMVYELQGSAVIERADIGAVDAAENLYLESGDRVRVKDESMMRMKLDNDKYITAEANTVFSLEAEGDNQDSKTRINLEQGAITNEIQNPLSGESLYETATPNSVMAVRGTIYRVELYDDGEGGQNMRLCCFEGTVATSPILPDGTMGEEVLVQAGSEMTVYSDGTADAVKDIDYESLPEQAIRTLSAMADSGASITGITSEELAEMVSAYGQNDVAVNQESEPSEKTEDTQKSDVNPAAAENSKQDENDSPKVNNGENNHKQTDKSTAGNGKTAGNETEQPAQKSENNTPASGNPSDSSGSVNTDSGNSDNGNSDQGSGDGNTTGNNKDKSDDDSGKKPERPSEPVTYTVTFRYDDGDDSKVFATQTVIKGGKAIKPILTPEATGEWNFDFDTPVTSDLTIEWKSEPEGPTVPEERVLE